MSYVTLPTARMGELDSCGVKYDRVTDTNVLTLYTKNKFAKWQSLSHDFYFFEKHGRRARFGSSKPFEMFQ